MNDQELTGTWVVLDPTPTQRRRIESRVFEWLEAHDTSLAEEWLGLLKVQPAASLGLAAAGTLSLALITPLGWVVSSLFN